MHTTPKISLALLLAGLLVSIVASRDLSLNRARLLGTNPKRQAMSYTPMAGIDKFWADIKWMQCINQMGGFAGKMDEYSTRYFAGQFERITDLDPDFRPAYLIGGSTIAYTDIDAALALIDKGNTYANSSDWERPYWAAFWVLQVQARTEPNATKKAAYQQNAIDYLSAASQMEGAPWYVESLMLHTQSRKDGVYGLPYKELLAWADYYHRQAETDADEDYFAPSTSDLAGMSRDAQMFNDEEGALGRLRKRILDRCQSLMATFLRDMRTATDAEKAEIQAKMDFVRDKVFIPLYPDFRYSYVSLAPYGPGDLYDRVSGAPVAPYGIDFYDYEINGVVSPLGIGGEFSPRTGQPVARDFEELKLLLGKDPERLAPQYAAYLQEEELRDRQRRDRARNMQGDE